MKKTILLVVFCFSLLSAYSQIVINEIMYNPPESGNDTTEYIELYNAGMEDISLMNYAINEGIEMIFGDVTIAAGKFLVITKDSDAFFAYYGFEAIEWDGGSLSNSGEDIILENANGEQVDVVDFDDGGSWPIEPDGSGYSLELCDPLEDNTNPLNWKSSRTDAGFEINGLMVFASPGIENEVPCDNIIDHTVDVLALQFDPKNLIINVNETVQWINIEGGNHNVNGSLSSYPDNPEGFYSGAPSTDNWVFTHTFTVPGMYKYKCDLHGAFGMIGTIEVLPPEAGKLVITEIMYNDPGDNDSLEFIEIYNIADYPINMEAFKLLSDNIDFTFPSVEVEGGDYFVISRFSETFNNYFGFNAMSWGPESLKNTADHIILQNTDGNAVDEVEYDDVLPWPTLGDGLGHSINLCRPELDNTLAENWQASAISAGTYFDDIEIFANPGSASYCEYDVAEITPQTEEGTILFDDLGVKLTGTVHGVNLRPGGLQITIIDDFNEGIALYSGETDYGYSVHEGDRIIILGKTGQYNGLTQIYLDTVLFYGNQHDLFEPMVVTELNEDTESQMVKLENVKIATPSDWGGGTSGFTVDVTDGTNTYAVRIDNDVDIFNENYPIGTFDITGIGGQFDNASPYLDGYQLIPRYIEDIDPFVPYQIPTYTIGEISNTDQDGVADSLGINCYIEGVVYGINLDGNGYNFTLIDDQNDGINIYSEIPLNDYEVNEGDRLELKGKVDQYNGLIEFVPDEITQISTGNPLVDALDVTALNEETESQLVKLAFLSLMDEADWKGDGSSFNVRVQNGSGEFELRIDDDCELSSMDAPEGFFHATGIGGQYDSSSPYTEGYQLFPRYADDIDIANNVDEMEGIKDIAVYPNPAKGYFSFKTKLQVQKVSITDVYGTKLIEKYNSGLMKFDITNLAQGIYLIHFNGAFGTITKRFLKIQ